MRRIRIVVLTVILLATLALSASAESLPYLSFDQTEMYNELAAPAAYAPVEILDGGTLGGGAWDAPQDMVFDKQGNLYVLDTKNNRIVMYDKNLKYIKEIKKLLKNDGTEDAFNQPRAIYISDKGFLYVADTDNQRCIKIDSNGKILREYHKPVDGSYTSEVFIPIKVLADANDKVYIISQNVYQGIIVFTDEGEFQGFFGSPPVVVSAKLLLDRFWKSLLSKETRKELADYVPVEFTSFDIDSEGLISTVSIYTDDDEGQISQMNFLGNNILSNDKNMGENEIFTYRREKWTTKFVDICVTEKNMLAIDSRYQRVYVYDRRGTRLFTFGTEGEQRGAFKSVAAIAAQDDTIYVLDSLKNAITVFRATPYGQLILEASRHDANGDYDEAAVCWEQVLSKNANYEMAYSGIGEAKLKNKDYAEAVKYFRLGNNRERESVAFGYYRTEWLLDHAAYGIGFALIILFVLIFLTNQKFMTYISSKCKRMRKPKQKEKKDTAFRLATKVMVHPLETLNEMKHKRYQSIGAIAVVLLLWVFVNVITRQFTSFRFNSYDPNTFDLPVQFALTVLPFLLVAATNWGVCAIMDGEGKFLEIATYLSFAALPYILFSGVSVALTCVMTLNEAVFIQVFQGIGLLWSLFLLFQSQRIVHNYSTGKTIGAMMLTVAGAIAVLIIILLLFALVLQVSSFVTSVYSEIMFRK